MAIDTKTTAGGVVLLFLSGSGSYLATNAVNGETTTPPASLEGGQSRSGDSEENHLPAETNEGQRENEGTTPANGSANTQTDAASSEVAGATEQPAASNTRQEIASSSDPVVKVQAESGTKISEKIISAKHLLIKDQADAEAKWKELADAIKTPKETAEQLKTFCTTNLEITYTSEKQNEFKEAIKKCTTLVTFKDRATQLGIALITDGEASPWKGRFDEMKEPNAKKLAQESGEIITWPDDSSKVSSVHLEGYCKAIEKLNWTTVKTSSNNTIEREWANYLKGCAKENNVTKDFWTGE